MSIFLEQVEDITVSYSIWGKIFGFGNIQIESARTEGQMLFKGVSDPLKKSKADRGRDVKTQTEEQVKLLF
jgi:hypothetical protein